jgi:hypothetical protein
MNRLPIRWRVLNVKPELIEARPSDPEIAPPEVPTAGPPC